MEGFREALNPQHWPEEHQKLNQQHHQISATLPLQCFSNTVDYAEE